MILLTKSCQRAILPSGELPPPIDEVRCCSDRSGARPALEVRRSSSTVQGGGQVRSRAGGETTRESEQREMASEHGGAEGPELEQGVELSELREGEPFAARVGGEPVVLVRRGAEVMAIGASCTHYGGPLAEGLVVGDTIRCPWHHACFSLRTGEAVRAPALNPVARYEVEVRGGRVYPRAKL